MRTIALEAFCNWIEQTPLSATMQGVAWAVPTVQTVHILAVAAVLISALLINLRLLGFNGRDQTLSQVIARFGRVIHLSVVVLFLTGCLLIAGEPARSLANDVFQLKMLLLLGVLLLASHIKRRLRLNPLYFEPGQGHRIEAGLLGLLSLSMWAGIVCAGRWIAYTYS